MSTRHNVTAQVALLGDIYRDIQRDRYSRVGAQMNDAGAPLPESAFAQVVEDAWRQAAREYLGRPDFRFWLLVDRSAGYYAAAAKEIGDLGGRIENFISGIRSPYTEIRWGTLACFPQFVLSDKQLGKLERSRLVDQAEVAVTMLPEIVGAERSCAWVRLMVHLVALRYAFNENDMAHAREFSRRLYHIRSALTAFDPTSWERTYTLDFSPIANEHPHLVPFDKYEAHYRLARSIGSMAKWFRKAAVEVGWDSDLCGHWLGIVDEIARTRWHLYEALLIGEDARARQGNRMTHHQRRDLERNSARALVRAVEAAADAGNIVTAAALACFGNAWIPKWLVAQDEYYRNKLRSLGALAHQSGFVINNEYVHDASTSGYLVDLCPNRLRREQSDESWQLVFADYPVANDSPISSLSELCGAIQTASEKRPTLLSAAITLTLRQGRLVDAAEALRNIAKERLVTEVHILDVAMYAREIFREYGFGVSPDTYGLVQDSLRRAIGSLESPSFSVTEWLSLHELLIGRISLAAAYGRDRWAASRFLRRFVGNARHDEFYRGAYFMRERVGRHRRGPGTVNWPRMQEFLGERTNGTLGSPLAISVFDMGEGRYHVLGASARNPLIVSEIVTFPDLQEDVDELRRSWRMWRNHPDDIPWNTARTEFATYVGELAQRLDPNAKWIMFVLDKVFNGMPMQLCLADSMPDTVVSIVPSFGWAALKLRPFGEKPRFVAVVDQTDPVILKNQKQFEDDLTYSFFQRNTPATMVLAHGVRLKDEEFAPAIFVNSVRKALHDWFPALGRRLALFHSCHSGYSSVGLLGDSGGIPTVVLGMGSPALLAPVVEVDIGTAAELNRQILRGPQGSTFGERYLTAVRANPLVGMYNFYGHADVTG